MIVPSHSFFCGYPTKKKNNKKERRRRIRYTSSIAKCQNALLSTIRKRKKNEKRKRTQKMKEVRTSNDLKTYCTKKNSPVFIFSLFLSFVQIFTAPNHIDALNH
jgi:hypothetical protein